MELNASNIKLGERYNWKDQSERLIFIAKRRYPGDPRPWYQFAKVEDPDIVWCEVLESDLSCFEETKE